MPRSRSSRSKRRNDEMSVEEVSEEEMDVQDEHHSHMQFSQQAPETSQAMQPVKQSERNNLENLGADGKEKVVVALSRLVLFKALAGEPIDRLKCAKEALPDGERITSAVFDEVSSNLRNVFGFELRRIPAYMEKSLPNKYKDRLFVINQVEEMNEEHSKAIHSVHAESSVEKGLLMIVLALAFCKGEPRTDGSRWISDADLYRLLHGIDENIPAEPPATANRKVSQNRSAHPHEAGMVKTPHVDSLLEKFVHLDYLLKEKAGESSSSSQAADAETAFLYSMGPRAAMEIGRRQIIFFCAEVLEEEPDPTMLQELEDEEDGEFMEEE